MNIIGLIAEYNPLHKGHLYQLRKIKEIFPDSIIILITNTCFTQRGDVSIINKWNKTTLALNSNIDIVVELPFTFATQSADIFAKGALFILNELKIDTLVFGSESKQLDILNKIANTQLYNKDYNQLVKEYLKKGINYPTALSKALTKLINHTVTEPNNLLALSYIKEIKKNNYSITPYNIKRIGSYHQKEITTPYPSASLIRSLLKENKDITPYIKQNSLHLLEQNLTLNSYFPYLKYKIITEKNLSIYQTVDEGIENRIKKVINQSNNWEELTKNIKTKRYTYNKINRMLIHILTSFTKTEAKNLTPDYIKILGFNNNGQNYLNKIKKQTSLPIITSYKPNLSKILDTELKITNIYNLPIKQNLIKKEYQKKPIIVTKNKNPNSPN